MHILILGKVWPEPDSSAAGSRILQLIRAFKTQGWKISFASPAHSSEFSFPLESLGIAAHTIFINDPGFDSFIRELAPDLVLFDRFSTEEQFGWRVAQQCPLALRVLDTEDLHCLRAARQQAFLEKRSFVPADLANDIAKREIASIYRCDLSLIISGYEMDLLVRHFKIDESLLLYIPFLAERITEEEIKNRKAFAGRRNFISIGNFLHAPNWDAVLFLKQEIWPAIRQQLPQVELELYGAYPSHKVHALNDPKQGFLIKGRADSVQEVFEKARICLAPLRFGAGLKGKLLDAMRYGTPNVTTPIGAEGMQGALEWNGRIATTATDFVKASVELYLDEAAWYKAQRQGIEIHNQLFDRDLYCPVLIRRLLELRENLPAQRQNNFTGAMLLHHTLQSTKYMALWIEAKNK